MKKILTTIELNTTPSKEEFISVMKTLWNRAGVEYKNIYETVYLPNVTAYHKKYAEDVIKNTESRARAYAEHKWKTEKKRNEYVDAELNKVAKRMNSWKSDEYKPLTYVDFDTNPACNGLSGNCCLSKFDDKELGRCYDEIKANEYFKSATAISIGYTESDSKYECYHDGLCHFRPQVYLTLPEDMQEKWDNDVKTLENAISEFYRNTNYCGD